MTAEEFAAAFRRARTASKVSLRDLSKVGRVSVEDVRAYEDGKALPPKAVFWRICVAVPRMQPLKQELGELLTLGLLVAPPAPDKAEGVPVGGRGSEEAATGRLGARNRTTPSNPQQTMSCGRQG